MKKITKKLLSLLSVSVLTLSLSLCSSLMASVTIDTKESYYQQYVQIIQEVQKNYNADIKIIPFDELGDEDFVDPEEFKAVVEDMAQGNYTVTANDFDSVEDSDRAPFSSSSATKYATVSTNSTTFGLAIDGKFKTQYSTTHRRQMFTGIESIKVSSTSSGAKWDHEGLGSSLLDGGRTYDITVQGYIRYGGAMFGLLDASVSFYCDSNGGVS